jgi:polyisoprenoid-binding protein YceI
MNLQPGTRTTRPRPPGRPPRRRRWWHWIVGGTVVVLVLMLGAIAAFLALAPSAAPLTLPAGPARQPSGALGGTWRVGTGSVAGFRVAERALGVSNEVGGRTSAVTGSVVIEPGRVTSARFVIGLRSVTVSGKHQAQFAASLSTSAHPVATFALAGPVSLSPSFATGKTVTLQVPGRLTLNGLTRSVTVTLSARRSGSSVQVAGSLPVRFARWRIRQPQGFGPFGSLASRGDAEFLLILRRS